LSLIVVNIEIAFSLVLNSMKDQRHVPKTQKQLNDLQKGRILQGVEDGLTYQQCADIVGVNKSTVCRLLAKIAATGTHDRRVGSGGNPKTSPTTDRLIVRTVKRDPFATASSIREGLALHNISVWTIRRRIAASGEFKSYWAAKKPFISERNIQRRLEWCIAHQNWTIEQWRRVIWTDESPFILRFCGKRRVWRRHNERYEPRCTVGTVKHDKKIMVWGGVCSP
jgi:transposase